MHFTLQRQLRFLCVELSIKSMKPFSLIQYPINQQKTFFHQIQITLTFKQFQLFILMIGPKCEVAVDLGGSALKISVTVQGDLSTPVKYPLPQIFSDRKQSSLRMAKAIKQVISHYAEGHSPTLVAFSFSGAINLKKNLILESWCLDNAQKTGNRYGTFDFATELKQKLKQFYQNQISVIFVNDSAAACLDPLRQQRLVLTFCLGTYPVICVSQKSNDGQGKINVLYAQTERWNSEIVLFTKVTIQNELRSLPMSYKNSLLNCSLLVDATTKILDKYQSVFNWQPQCFVFLGGNANVLKHVKQWPQRCLKVKKIILGDHDESVKSQMRGALFYAHNKDKIHISGQL